jgi:DNA-binding CsgD family transcriptional regulator
MRLAGVSYAFRMSPAMALTFLFALATGFVSLALVSRRSHHHYSPVTEALIIPILFYNRWILLWLIFRFVDASLIAELPPTFGRALSAGLITLSMGVTLQLGASYLAFTLRATRPAQPQDHLRVIQRAAALLTAGLALVYLTFFLWNQDPLIRVVNRGLVSLTFLTLAGLSLRLLSSTLQGQTDAASRNLRVLGAAHSILFVALTIFNGWYRLSTTVQRSTYVVITVGLEVIFNLVTVLWIHFFDQAPSSGAVTEVHAPPPAPPSLAHAYGISKREGEVIQLVCQGLTNQEIADTLFISLKTVKDHNYRIYQKTGVRNRVELTQLVRRLSMETDGILLPSS